MIEGEPAISVDTKKKELVGDFKNPGRELRPKGKVTDAEMAALAIERDAFHGEWNYTISPNLHPP